MTHKAFDPRLDPMANYQEALAIVTGDAKATEQQRPQLETWFEKGRCQSCESN